MDTSRTFTFRISTNVFGTRSSLARNVCQCRPYSATPLQSKFASTVRSQHFSQPLPTPFKEQTPRIYCPSLEMTESHVKGLHGNGDDSMSAAWLPILMWGGVLRPSSRRCAIWYRAHLLRYFSNSFRLIFYRARSMVVFNFIQAFRMNNVMRIQRKRPHKACIKQTTLLFLRRES